jgi:hypothetical protein
LGDLEDPFARVYGDKFNITDGLKEEADGIKDIAT